MGGRAVVVLAILQARMSSTRLPGKVLLPMLGEPAMARQLGRIKRACRLDNIIVATSVEPEDDRILAVSRDLGIECFRGSLHDVLDRYYQAALARGPDHVVRLTADCPLTDWRLIDEVVDLHLSGGYDYTSNGVERTYPIGLDAEIMTFAALEAAWRRSSEPDDREHVTRYLYHHPDQFRLGHLKQRQDLSVLRWTLDTQQDYEVIRPVFEALYPLDPDFTRHDVLRYLLAHPEIRILNADPKAKALYERLVIEAGSSG